MVAQPLVCFWVNLVHIVFSQCSIFRWVSMPPHWKIYSQISPQIFENLTFCPVSRAVPTETVLRVAETEVNRPASIYFRKRFKWFYFDWLYFFIRIIDNRHCTKNEVFIKDFISKCEQIQRIKKCLMENFIFCTVPFQNFKKYLNPRHSPSFFFYQMPNSYKLLYSIGNKTTAGPQQ